MCLGKATKVCDLLTDKNKEYEAVMLLGKITDTQDISGTVLKESKVDVTEDAVKDAVAGFVGDYMQIPPMYSALKVNGQKLCDLAREGKTVERKSRPVMIYQIEILEIALPRVKMRVKCSKGTYIRTLCQDIGDKLGCGACMESLLRTRVSEFAVSEAKKLSEIEQMVKVAAQEMPPEAWDTSLFPFIKPVDSVFVQYPKAVVSRCFSKVLYNGNRIRPEMMVNYESDWEHIPVRIYDEEGRFIGIYEYKEQQKDYKPVKIFMEE